jgi:polysaccharide export outer membrane protein
MIRSLVFSILSLILLIFTSGCATTDATLVQPQDFQAASALMASQSTAVLTVGNMIEISVEVDGRSEVPVQQATINRNGFVTLPLIGDVYVSGMDVNAARSAISKRYSSLYVSPPVIMLSLVSEDNMSEWGQVSVMGRVENPGPVPVPSGAGIKLSAAIQAAGGFAPSAKTSEIQVTRLDKRGRRLRVIINFDEIGASGNAGADLNLMDGDIVNIPERLW